MQICTTAILFANNSVSLKQSQCFLAWETVNNSVFSLKQSLFFSYNSFFDPSFFSSSQILTKQTFTVKIIDFLGPKELSIFCQSLYRKHTNYRKPRKDHRKIIDFFSYRKPNLSGKLSFPFNVQTRFRGKFKFTLYYNFFLVVKSSKIKKNSFCVTLLSTKKIV